MITKRRITVILLTFAMISTLLFAGCKNGNSNTSTETTQKAEKLETDANSESISTKEGEAETTESYEPATIRIGVSTGRTPHFTSLVAQEEGIFDKYNLKVELFEFSAGIDTINAIELGQVDVGYVADFAGLNRLGNLSNPDDSNLRFIARLERTATYALYADPDKVSSLEDLKGKSIALQLGTIAEYFNINALAEGGLTIDDAKIVSVDSMQTGMGLAEKGEVDALWIGFANIPKAEEYGYTKLVTQEELGLYQNNCYVSTDAYIASDAEIIGRYLKATAEAYDFIEENFEKATEDISKVIGMEKSVIADTLAGTTLQLDFPQDVLDDLSAMDQWLIENDYYENSVDFNKYINTDVIKAALPEAEVF